MIIVPLKKWFIWILVGMVIAEPQFQNQLAGIGAMVIAPQPPTIYVAPPPPPVHVGVPVPVHIPVPIGIRIENEDTSTTTTSTKKPDPVLKIYMPWPSFGYQIPAIKPFNILTNYSPSSNCTFKIAQPMAPPAPGFPMPFPMPVPGPPPVIMVPFPPIKKLPQSPSSNDDSDSSTSSSSSGSSDSDDSDSDSDIIRRKRKNNRVLRKKKRSKKRKKRYGILRSNRRVFSDTSTDRDEELKPVLSYLSRNGDIKLSRQLSKADAALLTKDDKNSRPVQKVQFIVGNDSNEKSRVKVIAGSDKSSNNKEEKKKIVLRRSSQQFVSGNKELVFRPPANKKISNFSMSFNVAR